MVWYANVSLLACPFIVTRLGYQLFYVLKKHIVQIANNSDDV